MLLKNPPKEDLEGDASFPDSYVRYIIMKEMGWTYQEYINQPSWIVDQVAAYIEAERASEVKGVNNGIAK